MLISPSRSIKTLYLQKRRPEIHLLRRWILAFGKLKKELEKLKSVNNSPVLVYTHGDLIFHLRDLDSEEEIYASEYSYIQVEEALRDNQIATHSLNPDKHNFSRSMRAAYTYRLAYVALAIRKIEWIEEIDGKRVKQEWNVDVRPNELLEVDDKKISKFSYFLEMVSSWGRDLPMVLYERMSDLRQKREELVSNSVYAEGSEDPPQQTEPKNFRVVDTSESVKTEEQEVSEESRRIQELRDKQTKDAAP